MIDTHTKTVEYVNAGHPAGYMCRDRKSVVPLDTGCCALGFLPDILIQKTVLSFETEVQIMLVTDEMESLKLSIHWNKKQKKSYKVIVSRNGTILILN